MGINPIPSDPDVLGVRMAFSVDSKVQSRMRRTLEEARAMLRSEI